MLEALIFCGVNTLFAQTVSMALKFASGRAHTVTSMLSLVPQEN
jgi:hypothetical protein